MAKAFRLPQKVIDFNKRKFKRQDKVASEAVEAMEKIMKQAVAEIMTAAPKGVWPIPSLSGMENVSWNYSKSAIEAGFHSARDEANVAEQLMEPKRRMAGKPKVPPARDLEKLLGNRAFMRKIFSRSKAISEKLRKAYLKKLKKTWDRIVPAMLEGQVSPAEVKVAMEDTWKASKSRVKTIFTTESTNYFADVQVAYFNDQPQILGFLFDSVVDSARTAICRSRHGLVFPPNSKLLRDNTPALHFNCRSHLIALANTPSNRKMVEDPQRDPTKRKLVPLDPRFKKR